MRSKHNSQPCTRSGAQSSAREKPGPTSWLLRLMTSFVLLTIVSSSVLAQHSNGLFSPAQPTIPITFQFTPDQLRDDTRVLSDCQTVAEMVPILQEEKGLLRRGWEAALRSADAYRKSAEINEERVANAEKRVKLEHENSVAKDALIKTEHDAYIRERRKNRWTKVSLIAVAIGAVVFGIKR